MSTSLLPDNELNSAEKPQPQANENVQAIFDSPVTERQAISPLPPPPYSPVPEAGDRLVLEINGTEKINHLEDMVSSMRTVLTDQACAMNELNSQLSDIHSLLSKLEFCRDHKRENFQSSGDTCCSKLHSPVSAPLAFSSLLQHDKSEQDSLLAGNDNESSDDEVYSRICNQLDSLILDAHKSLQEGPSSFSHDDVTPVDWRGGSSSDFRVLRENHCALVNSIRRVDSSLRTVDRLTRELTIPGAEDESLLSAPCEDKGETVNAKRVVRARRRVEFRRIPPASPQPHYQRTQRPAFVESREQQHTGWLFVSLVCWTLVLTLSGLLFNSWQVELVRERIMRLVLQAASASGKQLTVTARGERKLLRAADATDADEWVDISKPMEAANVHLAQVRNLRRPLLKHRSIPRLRRQLLLMSAGTTPKMNTSGRERYRGANAPDNSPSTMAKRRRLSI
ncbi:uncharacterized protein VTP21DRAFT_7057 [Calcarisporiella thermophila]|uniref:uncharacterized protein n=1 Tax=Calcarisporiella thermophila TaxID=911321 RepID=UPI00374429E9